MNIVGYTDAVYRYPIKGCRGLWSDSIECNPLYGIRDDRVFALVSATRDNPLYPYRKAITQRQCPQLAAVSVRPFLGSFVVTYGNGVHKKEFAIRVQDHGSLDRIEIIIHDPTQPVSGVVLRDRGSDFFSEFVGFPVELVCVNSRKRRKVQCKTSAESMALGFADGKPVLVTNLASLVEVNAALAMSGKTPVPMNRFRPNIVIAGSAVREEDTWRRIRIGEVELEYVEPCRRCLVTTVDQRSGSPSSDKEPLLTLSRLRPAIGGPLFGAYYAVRKPGHISAHMQVVKV